MMATRSEGSAARFRLPVGGHLLWVGAAALVAIAMLFGPGIFLIGRLWAEEASDVLPGVIARDFGAATLLVYRGTLQIPTSWAVWAGARFAFLHLPLVTFWVSVGVLLLLGGLFGWWAKRAGISPPIAALGFFAFLMAESVVEVIGTSINLQWLFSLCILLLLVMPGEALSPRLRWCGALALLAGLDGVPSCMIAPAFLLRARAERSRPHLVLGLILAATSLVQLVLILITAEGYRSFGFNPGLFLTALALHLAHPFAPDALVHRIGLAFLDDEGRTAIVLTATGAGALALGGLVRLARGTLPGRGAKALVALALLVTLANLFGAIGAQGMMVLPPLDGRYFVFILFTAMLLLVAATRSERRRARIAATAILALAAAIGVIRHTGAMLHGVPQAPRWAGQIAACRVHPRNPCRLFALPIDNGAFWPATLPGAAIAGAGPSGKRLP